MQQTMFDELVHGLLSILAEQTVQIVLYGSTARGTAEPESDIDIAVFGNQPRSRALTSKKYERFARKLYSFDNHAQAYDILYFRSGSGDSNPILHEISRGEELYARN